MDTDTPMEAEFDAMPGWTADAVASLGAGYAVPAACRGSASPAALTWLASRCRLEAGTRLVDVGGGMGGPAAHAREEHGVRPLLVDPMPGACRAARRMFGIPAVVGTGAQLPVVSARADAAWCVGVLCTTAEKAAVLDEIHRVLVPGARLGLFVLVADGGDGHGADVEGAPEGNDFPTRDELARLLDDARFRLVESVDLADLPGPPRSWQDRIARVDALVEARHGHEAAWQCTREQEERLSRLLGTGRLTGVLLCAET
ncbi:class I SAM-dependent methyltransferase [Pseudonocardia lutea]|uniref:Class I SAM-dependent methyltransferase n=1 Tax=Pseudonocardia lutea TaxID=2172015 RepID=A0ABW1I296_9PSEU